MARYIDADLFKAELNMGHCTGDITGPNDVEKLLDLQPTADVREVRRGKWILKNEGTYNRLRAYCSECGLRSGIGGIRKNQIKPFCPNCGAVMEVE